MDITGGEGSEDDDGPKQDVNEGTKGTVDQKSKEKDEDEQVKSGDEKEKDAIPIDNMEVDDKTIFAMQVWHCQNCIQLNQIEDDACVECNTPKDTFGLRPCAPSRAAPQVP
jgi:hypothetical protein